MQNSGKILIIVENLPVPFDTRVWQEATTLAANGYTVSVISPKGKSYTKDREVLQGVNVFRHDAPPEGNNAIGYFREYSWTLKEELRLAKLIYKEIGFDVIQGCNPPDDIYMVAKHFKKYGKNAFQIIRSTAAEALDDAEDLLRNSDPRPDIVLFDLPGSLNTNGVITTLSQMDYIFTPMCADRLVVESTLQFVSLFNDNLITTGISKTKGLYLFWTGVDGRERTELYDVYEDIAEELNVPILKTRLADTKQYRKNIAETRKVVFRSTIFPMDKTHQKSSRIGELVNEICCIIKG